MTPIKTETKCIIYNLKRDVYVGRSIFGGPFTIVYRSNMSVTHLKK